MTHDDDLLAEHRAALTRIDEAVARAATQAGDALQCRRGCASCCVAGLSVLPVEAALIQSAGAQRPRKSTAGMCAFLDDAGACAIYAVRPVVCRTHGLALKGSPHTPLVQAPQARLPILGDDVSACELNYTTRAPEPSEVLDATRIAMLLVTVDRRYRARVGLTDDVSRIPLDALAV